MSSMILTRLAREQLLFAAAMSLVALGALVIGTSRSANLLLVAGLALVGMIVSAFQFHYTELAVDDLATAAKLPDATTIESGYRTIGRIGAISALVVGMLVLAFLVEPALVAVLGGFGLARAANEIWLARALRRWEDSNRRCVYYPPPRFGWRPRTRLGDLFYTDLPVGRRP